MEATSKSWILVLVALGLLATVGTLLVTTPQLARAETHDVDVGESIQDAIDAASPGDTIRVAAGTFNVSLEISKSLVLEGGYTDFVAGIREPRGTKLQGSSRVIEISGVGVDVTVDGFEITGGGTDDDGAGIWAEAEQGCRVVIHDNEIHHNVADNYGGAIWARLADHCLLEITDNRIYSNTAGYVGGLYAYLSMSGTLVLDDNKILSNTADSEIGGFHAEVVHFGRFSVDRNEIRDNTTDGERGGFSFEAQSNSSGTFDDNEVIGNRGAYSGGGGWVQLLRNTSSTFYRNQFRDNEAESGDYGGLQMVIKDGSQLVGEDLAIVGNTASNGHGGASVKLEDGSSAILPGTVISGNLANAGDGYGGIEFGGKNGCRIDVPGLTVFNNRATTGSYGGVTLDAREGTTIIATNAQIISNTASGVGGGSYAYVYNGSLVDLTGSSFERNNADNEGGGLWVEYIRFGSSLLLNHTHFLTNTAGTSGGGYYSERDLQAGSRLEIRHSEFVANEAGGDGGAIRTKGPDASMAYINNTTFISNTAGSYGGAVYIYDFAVEGAFASFTGNTLKGNVAVLDGGAIYNGEYLVESGGTVLFNDNWIEGNRSGGDGGAASFTETLEGRVEMVDNTIISNTAGEEGGGLYVQYLQTGVSMTMTGNVINDNVAGGDGGGLLFQEAIEDGVRLYIQDNELQRNLSGEDGGGCFFDGIRSGVYVTFADNLVNHNTAVGQGGACCFESDTTAGSAIDMVGNEFNHNTSGSHHGGLLFKSVTEGTTIRFWENQVIGNRAGISGTQVTGGDVGGLGLGVIGSSEDDISGGSLVDLRDNQIVSNTAVVSGTTGGRAGGLYAAARSGGWLTMTGNVITGNLALDRYAGLWIELGGQGRLDMEQNLIAANKATTHTGGLYLFGENGPNHYFLRRNRIIDNEASGALYPGGLLLRDADGDDLWGLSENNLVAGNSGLGITLIDADWQGPNDTIADNSGAAFGISGTVPSTITLVNDIVWGNAARKYDPAPQTAVVVAEYSDVQGSASLGPTNLSVDPKFVGGGDYHLQAGSPVSNTADTSRAPAVDLDGVARPQGSEADMGCYEFVGAATTSGRAGTEAAGVQGTNWDVAEGGSIQVAINSAAPGDTIRVEAAVFTESLVITKSLTLEGGYDTGFAGRVPGDTTIRGGSRVISITGSAISVTVDGFEITAGDTTGDGEPGAGIYADVDSGSEVTIHDNDIHHNDAGNSGGGIWADLRDRCELRITENKIYSNTATSGGGLYATLLMSSTLTLDGNEVLSNTTSGDYGGLFVHIQYFGRYSVDDNAIRGNSAGGHYGGLFFEAQSNCRGTMDDNQVTANRATDSYGGGRIYGWRNASITFYRNRFEDNEAKAGQRGGLDLELYSGSRLAGEDLQVVANTAAGNQGGGKVHLHNGSSAMLPGTIISGNVAHGGDGYGGVDFYVDVGCRLEVSDLYVFDNRATAGPNGGVGLQAFLGSTIIATNTQVISNTTSSFGGGAYADIDKVSLLDLTGSRFERNDSNRSGGGLRVAGIDNGSTLLLNHSHFLSNTAGESGGGYYNNSGLKTGSRLEFSHAELIGNEAGGSGGAIRTQGPASSVATWDHNTFTGNQAGNQGGALYAYDLANGGSTASFSGNTLTGNVADGHGGAICTPGWLVDNGSSVRFRENWIEGNRSGGQGGGAYLDEVEEGSAEVVGNTIINNTASQEGGGLSFYHVKNGGILTMTGNIINDNVAEGDGGGLWFGLEVKTGSLLHFQDNELQRNRSGEDGGGCSFEGTANGGLLYMTGNRVSHNTAAGEGGGCHVDKGLNWGSALDMRGNEFNDNTAGSHYGALFVNELANGSTVRFRDNQVIGNRAGISGTTVLGGDVGGLAIGVVGDSLPGLKQGSLADLRDNQILSNTAILAATTGGRAAAAYAWSQDGGWLLMQENTLQDNVAGDSYGALWVGLGGEGRLDMVQNLIAANRAADDAGGLYLQGIDGPNHYFLRRNRFVDNESANATTAGGFRIEDGDGDDLWGISTNNLIAGNTGHGVWLVNADWYGPNDTVAGNSGAAFASSGAVPSTIELLNDIVWNNAGGLYQELGVAGSIVAEYSDVQDAVQPGLGNLSEDPMFVGSGDYHLQGVSPVIDKGDTTRTPSVDLEGDPRPQGAATDMGCYERSKAGVSLEPDQSVSQVAGSDAVYAFTLANGALLPDQFRIAVQANPLGWPATVVDPEVNLLPQASTQVQLRVTVPTGTAEGTLNAMVVRAESTSDGSVVDDAKLDITADLAPEVTLGPDRAASGEAGTTVVYSHTLTNGSNSEVGFDLAADSSQGWTATVSPTAVTLAKGKAALVMVEVEIPTWVALGMVDDTTVTATSQSDEGISDSAVDRTTVVEPENPSVYLPFVGKNFP